MISIQVKESTTWGKDISAFISFPFNQTLIDTIKALPRKMWHFSVNMWHDEAEMLNKVWEVPFSSLSSLFNAFSKYEVELTIDPQVIAELSKDEKIDYNFKTSPFNHQVDGFRYGMTHNRWLLGDEQGLGKTKQVIDIAVAKKAQRGYKHCLIVCGVNGLKWNWLEEIKTHSNETGWILGQHVKGSKISIGSTQDKVDDLKKIGHDKDMDSHYFYITNVESLRSDEIVTELQRLCKSGEIGMVAADEVHKMKNPQSQQGKGFLKVQADTMIAMTGTPLMNTPLDLYIILKWLGFENHSFYSFKNYYCEMGGYGNYQIVGYKHLDTLQAQLNEFMLRRLKKDVLDLPEKTHINEYVEMTAKQTQLYKEVYNSIMTNIDMVKASNNPLAEMIRLRQTTGFTGILSSAVQESAKLDRMVELVLDALDNDKQVVIFSNWTQMTDAIENALKTNEIFSFDTITGETKDEDRQNKVKAFQSGDTKVLIGTIGAMGTGLTLTAGTVEIFLDEPWNMALKDQAVDRCHRIGQHNNLTIYTLLTKNTIDERIHELVERKGAMANMLVDGKVVGDKGALVDYLLS